MKTLDYINDTLVHWTGRAKSDDSAFEILKSIVTEQLPYSSLNDFADVISSFARVNLPLLISSSL
jgi:hypothetical protein